MSKRLLLLALMGTFASPTRAAEPNWDALTQEAGRLLSEYIRIDTTNPPGNELPAARFLERVLAQGGIGATLYRTAENRGNLLARLPGTGRAQPVLLLHHMDVVPVEPADWSFPPFSGEIHDGYVYGRGALDDKSHGVVQLMALLARVREQRPCGRDLIYLAVADEEVGGELGAQYMVQQHPEQVRAAAVWNEGGATVEGILGDRLVSSVAVTEKNSLWMTIVASGEGGHGSAPTPNGAVNILAAALSRIAAWETPIHLIPAMREMFGRIGGAMFPGGGLLLRNLDTPLVGRITAGRITRDRVTNGLVRNTIALTGLRGGVKHNVIPQRAEADLDVRLLPDQVPEDFVKALAKVIDDPRVTIVPSREIPELQPPSPSDTPFFQAVERALAQRLPSNVTVPGMLTGGSDCKAFRRLGTPCYGYQPMIATVDMIRRIHGIDERISLDNLRFGIQVTYDTLAILCEEGR
jgi:acetylornithine deacetylase/succinyl-diaminopimelate desuccinylase-like protein